MSDMVILNNACQMPLVGLGTGKRNTPEEIRTALDMGYRHIDTAYAYDNEEMIGEVLQEYFTSGKLKREDVFITSKLMPTFRKDKIAQCLEESLKKLRLDYVDLYLDHFPASHQETGVGDDKKTLFEDVKLEKVWKAMEEFAKQGKAKSIGVSNYNMAQITRILNIAEIKPVTNQIECHLYLQQPKMYQFLKERGITITAYSPLGAPHRRKDDEPKVLENTIARQLATKYNKSVGQILLRHMVQRDIAVVPKSGNPNRQEENMNIFDFHLSDEDMAELAAQDKEMRFNNVERLKGHPEYPFDEPV